MTVRQGLLMAHVSVLLFGLSGVIAKIVPQSATVLTGGRAFIGALALGLYLIYRKQMIWPERKSLIILGASGLLLALHWISFYHSIKVSSVSIGVVAVTTFPVMTALVEPLVLRQPWRWSFLLSPMLVVIGTLVMLGINPTESDVSGLFWGFVAAAIYTIIHFINKLRVEAMSGLMLSFIQLLVAGTVLLPWVIIDYKPSLDQGGWDITRIVFLAIFCTAIAYSLFIESMRSIPARTTAVLSGLEPVYAISIMVLFYDETLSWNKVLGAAIIVGGVVWSSLQVKE